jgi:hypothetical protein
MVAAACFAPASRADEHGESDPTFDRGLAAMLKGDYATACPLLATSYRADPRLGTLFTLAECESQSGKPAHALAHYQTFLRDYRRPGVPRSSTNDERSRIAESRRAALAGKVGYLTVVVPTPAPNGLAVEVDDEPLAEDAIGVEAPAEPGPVVVRLRVPGRGPRETRLDLAVGEHRTVMLTLIEPEAPPPTPVATASVPQQPPPPAEPERADTSPYAFVTGGFAIVGIAVGTVAGLVVVGKKSAIDAGCPADRCNAAALDDVHTARTAGAISTVAFALGGAALISTVAILLVGRARAPATKSRAVAGASW